MFYFSAICRAAYIAHCRENPSFDRAKLMAIIEEMVNIIDPIHHHVLLLKSL